MNDRILKPDASVASKCYHAICGAADKIAYSWMFILLVAAMSLYANIYAAELQVYTAYIVFAICICAFCRDLLPIMPMVVCSYIAPSIGNNPGKNPESIFFPEHGGYFLISIAALFVIVLVIRLILDREIGFSNMFRVKRRLIWGMVILGAAYLVSGIGMEIYDQLIKCVNNFNTLGSSSGNNLPASCF